MRKNFVKIISFFTALTIILSLNIFAITPQTYSENVKVYFNGQDVYSNTEYQPIIINDRTMVRIVPIFEAMGWNDYKYDPDNKTVKFFGSEITYEFINDKSEATIIYTDGSTDTKSLDVPATLYNDVFYVPLRAFCELVGNEISWNSSNRTVYVSSSSPDKLSFKNFIGEWGKITELLYAQSFDVTFKILSVDENNKTITLAYKYDMDSEAVWEGGSVHYREPITVPYHEEPLRVENPQGKYDEVTGLVTDAVEITGSKKEVDAMLGNAPEKIGAFKLMIANNNDIYYQANAIDHRQDNQTATCYESTKLHRK